MVINLRYPLTESSSASLIKSLAYGKNTIVLNYDHYASNPDYLIKNRKLSRYNPEIAKYAYDGFKLESFLETLHEAYDFHFQYLAAGEAVKQLISESENLIKVFLQNGIGVLDFNL